MRLAQRREIDPFGRVTEQRLERRARRALRGELGDDHLDGLLHRREAEERHEAVDREHRLRRVDLDGPLEQTEEQRRAARHGAGVEAVAVRLDPRARVGPQLRDLRVEVLHEPQRAHGAIDGPRELLLAEHREQLAACRRHREMNLHEAVGRVHVAARPGRLLEITRVDGGVAELVALDAYLSPRSGQLHSGAYSPLPARRADALRRSFVRESFACEKFAWRGT